MIICHMPADFPPRYIIATSIAALMLMPLSPYAPRTRAGCENDAAERFFFF